MRSAALALLVLVALHGYTCFVASESLTSPEADLLDDLRMVESTERNEKQRSTDKLKKELATWKTETRKLTATAEDIQNKVANLTSQDMHAKTIVWMQERLERLSMELNTATADYLLYRNETDRLQTLWEASKRQCEEYVNNHDRMLNLADKMKWEAKHIYSSQYSLLSENEMKKSHSRQETAQKLRKHVSAMKKAGKPIDPNEINDAFDVIFEEDKGGKASHEHCKKKMELEAQLNGTRKQADAAYQERLKFQKSRDSLLNQMHAEQQQKKRDSRDASSFGTQVAQTASNFNSYNNSHTEALERLHSAIQTNNEVIHSISVIRDALEVYGYDAMMGMEKEEAPPPPSPGYSHDHISDEILFSGAEPQVLDTEGCNNSAGLHWCPSTRKCQRLWQDICEPPAYKV